MCSKLEGIVDSTYQGCSHEISFIVSVSLGLLIEMLVYPELLYPQGRFWGVLYSSKFIFSAMSFSIVYVVQNFLIQIIQNSGCVLDSMDCCCCVYCM